MRQVVLPRKAESVTLAEPVVCLGDYKGNFIVSANKALYSVDETGTATSLALTLSAAPYEKEGIAFRGTHSSLDFYIAVVGGYQVYNGTTLTVLRTNCKPLDWAEWDNKLYGIQADGQLGENPDGQDGTWTFPVKVDNRYTPMHLLDFYDRQDEPCLHIVCKEAVFAVDRANTKTVKTTLRPPRHPYSAMGATVFRTDMYVSYGLGVDQYTGSAIIPTGLDRDYGMPLEYRGYIHYMADGYNGVYAMVNGGQVTGDWPQIMTSISRHQVALPGDGSPTAIMIWNVNGWHTVWNSGQDLADPTNMVFSNANDTFRLYWGFGGSLRYIDFPTALFNPIQRDPGWVFEKRSYIEYGALDFSTTGMLKIMVGIEIRSKDVTATEVMDVEYSVDGGSWVSLGQVNVQPSLGTTRLLMGSNGVFPDSVTPRYDGVSADSIRVRVWQERGDDETKSPILESVGIVYQKIMGTLNGYEFTVDCTINNGYNGKTNAQIQQFLQEMIDIGRLIPWWHQNQWKSVRLAGVSGTDETGVDIKGNRQVALLEVVEDAE
jgi:hypothetical protein